jgi:hypothetical protein
MDTVFFNFKGNNYSVHIQANTSEQTHYYWCYFCDQKLKEEAGECITFKTYGGDNLPEPVYAVDNFNRPVIDCLKATLQQYIERKKNEVVKQSI